MLSGWERIPVCVAYDVDGERTDELPLSQSEFHHAKPIYEFLPGWDEDISHARRLEDLPANARSYIEYITEVSGTRVSAVGVGPDRDATITLHDLID